MSANPASAKPASNDAAALLRHAGLRVTLPQLAVLDAPAAHPVGPQSATARWRGWQDGDLVFFPGRRQLVELPASSLAFLPAVRSQPGRSPQH